jgi:transposase
MEYIAMDVHKRYSLVRVEDGTGKLIEEVRLDHAAGVFRSYLAARPQGSPVAIETTGSWYWVVDEVEAAGQRPQLVNAWLAKRMMGQIHKSDRLDCRGLNRLQRTGTLPTVWIAPSELRDRRELPRTRMALVGMRTRLKNRIHGALAKHGIKLDASDAFGRRGREELAAALARLPAETAFAAGAVVREIDALHAEIDRLDKRIAGIFCPTEEIRRLRTLPGVGPVLAVVIAAEIGDVVRFARPQALASYAGLVPRLEASGGRVRFGKTPRRQVSLTPTWAFVEAANAAVLNARRRRGCGSHVPTLYQRVRAKRDHGHAIVAVARHLAEAAHVVLTRRVDYRDPAIRTQG